MRSKILCGVMVVGLWGCADPQETPQPGACEGLEVHACVWEQACAWRDAMCVQGADPGARAPELRRVFWSGQERSRAMGGGQDVTLIVRQDGARLDGVLTRTLDERVEGHVLSDGRVFLYPVTRQEPRVLAGRLGAGGETLMMDTWWTQVGGAWTQGSPMWGLHVEPDDGFRPTPPDPRDKTSLLDGALRLSQDAPPSRCNVYRLEATGAHSLECSGAPNSPWPIEHIPAVGERFRWDLGEAGALVGERTARGARGVAVAGDVSAQAWEEIPWAQVRGGFEFEAF